MESVEDEWERELHEEKDLDLLFVTYHPDKVSVESLMKKIQEHGFQAQLKK